MEEVLETLIIASERAAAVARSCTGSTRALLVAEKGIGEANTRFDRDFKTIADVLAQESAKAIIESRFPELTNHIRGEECAEIGGVRISLQENIEQTAQLLGSLLPYDAALRMAEAAHLYEPNKCNLPTNLPDIDSSDLAVWIDPIDGTAEFIAGVSGKTYAGQGLPCVTVLIGAYLKSTGEPIIGVVNQPFFNNGKGRIVWGISYGDTKILSSNPENNDNNTILMSAAEKSEIVDKFKRAGWNVVSVPGAGHKLLKVALDEAAAYIVTKGTTFRWDTCAPHSMLRAKGGDIVNYTTKDPILYNVPDNPDTQKFSNSEGIIAYNDASVFQKILDIIN